MIRSVLIMITLCWVVVVSTATEDPEWSKVGPVVIELSPLDKVKLGEPFFVRVLIISKAGRKTNLAIKVSGRIAGSVQIAQVLKEAFPEVIEASLDGDNLIIKSYEGNPVDKVEVTCDGLPEAVKRPQIKRLPKETPGDSGKK